MPIRRFLLGLAFMVPLATAVAAPIDGPALDHALKVHRWDAIGPALSDRNADAAEIASRDRWMQGHLRSDPNFFLAMLMSRDDWRLGAAADGPSADALKRRSGEMALLAIALIVVDGEECQDRSAPGHRLDQAIQQRAASLQYLRASSTADRDAAVRQAAATETATANARDESDLICRDGLAQTRTALEHGSQVQLPTPPGQVGKTVTVFAPAGWQPPLLPPDLYRPLQQRDRTNMRAILTKVVGG